MESTASLVVRYAARFDAVVGTTGHTVASPLGAWLLIALAAPLTTGDERAAVEAVLGTTADDAHSRAEALLARPHAAVAHAVAVWHRKEFVRPAFTDWTGSLHDVETGEMPTPARADRWAAEQTHDLIEHFPVSIDGSTAIVLASALATKVKWTVPFNVTSSRRLHPDLSTLPPPDSWAALVRTVLETRDHGHEVHVFDTERAGPVGVDAASAREGLTVVSVIADPTVARADVRGAAHDVAAALLTGDAPGAHRAPIAELPIGAGHSWSVAEYDVDADRDPPTELAGAVLPAWQCAVDHDLLATGAPGVTDTLGVLAALTDDSAGSPQVQAAQSAVARFTAKGFEAAAVTALDAARGMPRHTIRQRRLEVRFARPYAVVAVARDDAAPTPSDPRGWHGVPVFSAWVEQPTEAARS